ncbi:MAG: TIM barrel protein [Chloroflexia bacterium]|nr:TIM barrel protein [Chloroflexia bacterium]
MTVNAENPKHNEGGRLRIGTAPVNWNNNDLPNWRPFVPFPAILDEMQSAGYLETEWDQSFGGDSGTLNRERIARGMTFAGAYRWMNFLETDEFERDLTAVLPYLETLQGIGASHLIVADSLRPHRVAIAGSVSADGSASLDEPGYDRLAANLDRLADAARSFGLAVHYHNHVGSYIETPAELDRLMIRLDDTPVDLCFDTGHYAFGGGDAFEFLSRHHARVGYLHLKDVDEGVLRDAKMHCWSFLDALRRYIFCPLGAGNARIADTVQLLVSVGFNQYVIIEQDTCRNDSTVNARVNLEMVRTFEQAGDPMRRMTL